MQIIYLCYKYLHYYNHLPLADVTKTNSVPYIFKIYSSCISSRIISHTLQLCVQISFPLLSLNMIHNLCLPCYKLRLKSISLLSGITNDIHVAAKLGEQQQGFLKSEGNVAEHREHKLQVQKIACGMHFLEKPKHKPTKY